MKKIIWLFLLLLCSHQVIAYPLWGNLKPGQHAVGFTVRLEYDHSRVFHAKYDASGKLYSGPRERPIQIAIWYPAAQATAGSMHFEDYVYLLAQELDFSPLTPERQKEAIAQWKTQRTNFARASDAGLQTLLQTETAAHRDAAPLRGKFPLIVYAPGAGGTTIEDTILCEYLASYGYIV